jgi:glycosyltransferase involved in cell wall biosynthesis
MKILHASHTHLKSLGARNYFLPVRINNGFIRNNHEVYWFSDRDVARYSSWFHSRKTGVGACNRKFLEVCRNFEPDVIALSSQDILKPETIAQARKLLPNVAVFQYYIDALYLKENLLEAKRKAEVVDWTFATTAGPFLRNLAGKTSKVAYIPNPIDPSIDIHRCHEHTDQPYDVFFAGNISKWLHPDDLRGRAYELIRERIPYARCAFYGHGGKPSLFGAAFMKALVQAKIGLNFSQRNLDAKSGPGGELYLYSSDRIGLYQGNGLLVFTTKSFSLSDLYGEDAIVEVEDADDFINKLRYYIENDDARQKVAQNGYELGHREFNERLVSQYMIEATLGLSFSHSYAWPMERFPY